MKRFRFSLERVLDLRRQQEELESNRLQSLAAERSRLERRARQLGEDSLVLRSQCGLQAETSALELRWAYEYARVLERTRKDTLAQAALRERQRQDQLAVVVDARRNVRLLERLRSRQRRRHGKLADREQQTLAAELHLAKLRHEQPEKNL